MTGNLQSTPLFLHAAPASSDTRAPVLLLSNSKFTKKKKIGRNDRNTLPKRKAIKPVDVSAFIPDVFSFSPCDKAPRRLTHLLVSRNVFPGPARRGVFFFGGRTAGASPVKTVHLGPHAADLCKTAIYVCFTDRSRYMDVYRQKRQRRILRRPVGP